MSTPRLFCPYCGASLPSDSRFCESCGKPLPVQARAAASPAPGPAAALLANKGLLALLAVAVLAGVLGCVTLVAGLVLYRRAPSTTAANPPAAAQATATLAVVMPEAPTPELLQPTPVRVEPSPLPPPTEPVSPLTRYDFDGVTFSYDPFLAAAVEPQTFPAQQGTDIPPWELAPQHRQLSLLGYPLQDTFHQPKIYIYPLQDYYAVDPGISDRIATLQQMLIVQRVDNLPETLPFFPTWNAGQIMYTKVQYLKFPSGLGVRYLAQYGQAAYPISNQTLFYTFQGLSNDGRWLVSAVLPVANPVLPDPEPLLQDPAFYDTYPTYLAETRALLNQQPDGSFTPDLALLDALFMSLEIR